MKLLFLTLLLSTASMAQDLSNPELDYYQEAPINEEEFSDEELRDIQQSQEEVPYTEEYDDELLREDTQKDVQQMEEDYVE